MQLLNTIFLAGCLLSKMKDTTKPVFNMYAITHDTPTSTNNDKTKHTLINTKVVIPKQAPVQVKVKLGSQEHPYN